MRPIYLTLDTLTNDDNGIAELQDLAGADFLELDGALVTAGVANLVYAQIVGITSAGNDTGITFLITGTYSGQVITETVTGSNATVALSTQYFDTVTSIYVSGATASTGVYVGTLAANGAVSDIVVADWRQRPFNVGMGVTISGTLTCTVQHTFDDIYTDTTPTWHSTDGLTAITDTDEGNFAFPCRAARLRITAYTSGSATFSYIQASC